MSEDLKQRPMVMFQPSGRRDHVSDGKTIAQAAQEMGVDIESICGGAQGSDISNSYSDIFS